VTAASEPELAAALDELRAMLLADQAPGVAVGWMFPSSAGTLRVPSSLYKAWRRCMEVTGIEKRFTVHGMRYTFTDLGRRAKVAAMVRRALTGHVTERMQHHDSHVGNDESELLSPGGCAWSRPPPARSDRSQWGLWWGPPAETVRISTTTPRPESQAASILRAGHGGRIPKGVETPAAAQPLEPRSGSSRGVSEASGAGHGGRTRDFQLGKLTSSTRPASTSTSSTESTS
jgi:hypothetical protein